MKKARMMVVLMLFLAVYFIGCNGKVYADERVNATYHDGNLLVNIIHSSKMLKVAVWGDEGGQNDINWYSVSSNGENAQLNTEIVSHHESGRYNVHVYDFQTGKPMFVGATELNVDLQVDGQVQVNNINDIDGSYEINFMPSKNANLIANVYFPTWTIHNGQDDIIWHKAVRDGNKWKLAIQSLDHNYEVGEYISHIYVQDLSGKFIYINQLSQNVKANQEVSMSSQVDDNQKRAIIDLRNYRTVNPNLKFAVWGEKDGQNDIQWLNPQKNSNSWQVNTDILSHNESGKYQVHIYDFKYAQPKFVGSTTFDADLQIIGNLQIVDIDNLQGSYKIVFTPNKNQNLIKEIYFPTWTKKNGQDDLVWYKAQQEGNDWYAIIASSRHNFELGQYISHVYVKNIIDKLEFIGVKNQEVTADTAFKLSATADNTQKTTQIQLQNYRVVKPDLKFAVWGEANGQNDIQWYSPTQQGNNWQFTVNTNNHREGGSYQVHVYDFKGGKPKFVGMTTFNIQSIAEASPVITAQDDNNQTFDIQLSEPQSPATLTGLKFAVWSEASGQDDLKWYDAKLNGNQYTYQVDTANHKDSIGKYFVHAYASDERGIFQIVGHTTLNVTESKAAPQLLATVNPDKETVTLKLKHWSEGGEVLLPTWGEKDGQNDIQWYAANKIGRSSWQKVVPLGNHMELGTYNAHAYSRRNNQLQILGQTQFNITDIKANFITFSNQDPNAGTFTATLNNLLANGAVKGVRMAVWTNHNGQDDLKWYNTTKQNHNYVLNVNTKNHYYESGLYHVHVYVDYSNGSNQLIAHTTTNIKVNPRRYQNPAPYYQIKNEINIGDSGYNLSYGYEGLKVAKVIQRLGAGSYIGMGGAHYGPRTQFAVRQFQARSGLPVNGVVDLHTWKAMGLSEYDWYHLGAYVSPLRVNRQSSRSDHIEAMISRAYDYLGNPYVIGASGAPGLGLDCSGLVMQALYAAGLDMSPINPIRHALPGYEYESRNMWASPQLMKVPYGARQRGDLIFYHDGRGTVIHVAIYLGNNQVIESWPNRVMISSIVDGQHPYVLGVGRPFI